MFRITCFVKDRKLPDVLRALDSIAYDVKASPATGPDGDELKVVRKTIRRKANGKAGNHLDLTVFQEMPETFRTAELKKKLGHKSAAAIHDALNQALKQGLVVRVRTGVYQKGNA